MYKDFFADRLAQLRLKKGVSAREMSLSLDRNDNYINTIENKKSWPSMLEFFSICEYLAIAPSEFFDYGNSDPVKLNDIVADLKKLDDYALTRIAEVIKVLASK